MQDPDSQSNVNPGRVERALDETPVEREGMQGVGGVEREGLGGGPGTGRERPDGGQVTEREALDAPGDAGREGALNSSRSGGMENRPGDRSDPMPGEELH